jgi:hypothetical protein
VKASSAPVRLVPLLMFGQCKCKRPAKYEPARTEMRHSIDYSNSPSDTTNDNALSSDPAWWL